MRSWREFLELGLTGSDLDEFCLHERTGRPLGPEPFVVAVGCVVGRDLRPRKPGPKPKGF